MGIPWNTILFYFYFLEIHSVMGASQSAECWMMMLDQPEPFGYAAFSYTDNHVRVDYILAHILPGSYSWFIDSHTMERTTAPMDVDFFAAHDVHLDGPLSIIGKTIYIHNARGKKVGSCHVKHTNHILSQHDAELYAELSASGGPSGLITVQSDPQLHIRYFISGLDREGAFLLLQRYGDPTDSIFHRCEGSSKQLRIDMNPSALGIATGTVKLHSQWAAQSLQGRAMAICNDGADLTQVSLPFTSTGTQVKGQSGTLRLGGSVTSAFGASGWFGVDPLKENCRFTWALAGLAEDTTIWSQNGTAVARISPNEDGHAFGSTMSRCILVPGENIVFVSSSGSSIASSVLGYRRQERTLDPSVILNQMHIPARAGTCMLSPTNKNEDPFLRGIVQFQQSGKAVKVFYDVYGLDDGHHVFHLNEFGNLLDGESSSSTGQPFLDKTIVQYEARVHPRFITNRMTSINGRACGIYYDASLTLQGKKALIGRSLVVYGSNNQSKSIVGHCVIGIEEEHAYESIVEDEFTGTSRALCTLEETQHADQAIEGFVEIEHVTSRLVRFRIVAAGLAPGLYHWYIHEKGDVSSSTGSQNGPFFEGECLSCRQKNESQHIGFIGNGAALAVEDNGILHHTLLDPAIRLYGENNVIGRSIVIHAEKRGKAVRIAQCVIGIADTPVSSTIPTSEEPLHSSSFFTAPQKTNSPLTVTLLPLALFSIGVLLLSSFVVFRLLKYGLSQ